jgi:hypothetical protein
MSLILNLETATPGLEWLDYSRQGASAVVLALDGLSQAGRFDPAAFDPQSLTGSEITRGRLEALYQPRDWHGLAIRAAWSPTALHDGIDLEIQASAPSSAVFSRVEVHVSSRSPSRRGDSAALRVSTIEPGDRQSALNTADGDEAAMIVPCFSGQLLAENRAFALQPLIVPVAGENSRLHYVEMAHPDDVVRRIIEVPAGDQPNPPFAFSRRYGLLGHDLEKGIVLRARMRGLWIDNESPEETARSLYREFLSEPPPLGP